MVAGFRRACVLFAALDLRVFDALEDCDAPVAGALGLGTRETETLLRALAAQGLLELQDGRFRLGSRYRPFLLSGPESAAADLARYSQENVVWLELAEILRGNKQAPQLYSRELFDGKAAEYPALRKFNALHARAMFDTCSEHIGRPRRILDMGGGDGVLAAHVLERFDEALVTILELEGGAQPAIDALAGEMSVGRLRIIYGDACEYVANPPYDLVIVNELLELFGAEDKARIVRSALASTAPGGLVMITKFALDAAGVFPLSSALFSVRMLLKTGGYLETDPEISELLADNGAKDIRVFKVGPLKTTFLASRD